MGFGLKWMGWMWRCISTAKFSVLVNGVLTGFFSSTKGLRQGDPLSPYLFVMGMEVLRVLIRRAVQGGFLSARRIRGRRGTKMNISHLFFADDTIIFCEAKKEHLTHLSWTLFWFEAASGLRINLAKSEIIPVGEVEEVDVLVVELGCRVGSLPSSYLGLPLGAPNKSLSAWDGVEERVRRRLALWKRQYISKGGRITLIKTLSQSFPQLFALAVHRNATVEEVWDQNFGQGGWNLRFFRAFNDWELDLVRNLLIVLRGYKLTLEDDLVSWKGGRNGQFGVKEAYRLLITPNDISFPKNYIWVDRVPTKVAFFVWKATWGKVLTLDRLQKRG
ncbi:putative mitochondrial protein [Vitis vinifera]|uniref:Putative mitochondrial protein n=1 Tax=Vitis vinifera TaxID=29760 RepID=A0A438ISW9_VITVI|nr:putative mitochondrial protein [Vitis vinifera]